MILGEEVVSAMVVEVIVAAVVASKVVGYCLVTANSESVLEFEGGIPSLAPENFFEEKLSSCMLYLMEIKLRDVQKNVFALP